MYWDLKVVSLSLTILFNFLLQLVLCTHFANEDKCLASNILGLYLDRIFKELKTELTSWRAEKQMKLALSKLTAL